MSVIEIGALRVQREQTQAINGKQVCRHNSLSFNRDGHVIRCRDCGDQVEPFWAFEMLIENYRTAMLALDARIKQNEAAMAAGLTTKAARNIEEAWRSRKMAPACPHCREAIFPQDGFGSVLVNRDMALRRRQIASEKKGG
jgi:hypothetical protein